MKCFGQLKSVTVWLVLLGFLCGMMVPSVVMGKVFRDIDTEGDPGDGDEYDGGDSGGTTPVETGQSSITSIRFGTGIYYIDMVPVMIDGVIVFCINISNLERKK